MNQSLSFSISLAAHVGCILLLFLTSGPAENKPIIAEVYQVALLAPGRVGPVGSPSKGVTEREAPRPVVNKAMSAPRPVFITRPVTRKRAAPPVERPPELPRLSKLEKESLPAVPEETGGEERRAGIGRVAPGESVGQGASTGDVAVSAGGASSYDAYIAGVIKSNWVRPSRAVVGQDPPSVSVAIKIGIDGRITVTKVVRSSGISLLDASALRAIERSNPLPIGLPSSIACRYYDVTIVFRITDEA